MDDHTGGPPEPVAEQADNDLAVGRIIDIISHSKVWDKSRLSGTVHAFGVHAARSMARRARRARRWCAWRVV